MTAKMNDKCLGPGIFLPAGWRKVLQVISGDCSSHLNIRVLNTQCQLIVSFFDKSLKKIKIKGLP